MMKQKQEAKKSGSVSIGGRYPCGKISCVALSPTPLADKLNFEKEVSCVWSEKIFHDAEAVELVGRR